MVTTGAAVSELQFNIIREDPFVVHDLKVWISFVVHMEVSSSFSFKVKSFWKFNESLFFPGNYKNCCPT